MAHGGESPAAALLRKAACFVDVVFRSRLWDRGFAMFQRLIDDFKDSTGTTLRMISLAAAAAMALLVTTGFLCAAAFVLVLQKYGPVQACLTGAAIFFVVTLIAAGSYMIRHRRQEADPDPRGRRTGAGISRKPRQQRQQRQRSAGGVAGAVTCEDAVLSTPAAYPRHCERSEAIHSAACSRYGLLYCARNDVWGASHPPSR
jgi:hypothetical protein